jgi:hypothetical protein
MVDGIVEAEHPLQADVCRQQLEERLRKRAL